MTYFDQRSENQIATIPMVYGVTQDGEVREITRKAPGGFTSVAVQDFYAGDSDLVTLLYAERRDDDGTLRDSGYFLSMSDHDGDHAALKRLDVRFKPLKLGIFGSGNLLVLGWDESNQMPVLALVKDSGAVLRFLDLSSGRTGDAGGLLPEITHADAARKTLQDAAFVPLGRDLLLTYPGTDRPLRVLSEVGESRSVPLPLPGGYVLRDVINSGSDLTLVVRAHAETYVAPTETAEADRPGSTYPSQRLFEINGRGGPIVREFLFDKPNIMALTCAAGYHLTAIFPDTLAGQTGSGTGSGQGGPVLAESQLVVSTVRR